ncbi:hypothetical protein A3K93_13300 (plasmid) [Acinetobacter sp. NCu2D-2]|uniref:hypothetical protein n=1 Tax=Acinetobacter sp. NCu2D-2 TaxID=1608473 RepID=UPI0007CDC790|nr:hypothetical protein [Acinetobacter sp. NCu2D-2]ANF83220.1 hypothetical protein A3K93_13300 [Acinetobacter sp. NCu2D-2]
MVLETETKVQDYLNQKKNEFYQLYWTISLETNPKNRNHIWRYIEFFINSIDQIKSKKGIKTKEEKSKGIKRLRRIGSLPNEPVQVKLLEVERRDEDDENDEQAVSIHINLDADTVTSRTRGIGQSAEQIAQIIYRRHYPTVFNPVYLEPELLEIVYNVLIDKFTYQPGSDESQVAAVFLLSLFTGSPVSAFLNIKDLFETEVLSRAIDIHGYLFRYSTSLETTKLEGNIGEYQKILGTSHHWNILLPASWVDSASALKGMVSSELNSYLKLWFSEYCIGRLSVETLAQQIHFQIARLDPKSLIKEFIKNQKIYHEPTLAYAVFNTTSINRCYANFLKLMKHHSTSTEYIEGHTSEIDHPLIWPNNAKKVGSQKVWSKHQAKLFIAALKQDLEEKLSSPKIDVKVQVNTYATWIWTISMLTLGIRPNTGAPGLMMHYDEQLQLIYVHDKKSGSRPYGRYIPVTKFLKQEIQQYREFLKKVNPKAYRRAQKKHDLICYIDKGKQLTGVTAEFIDAQLKAKGFNLYKNWARHFLIAEANLPIDIQKSLYAHDSTDLGFAEYSSISFAVYKKKIIAAVEKLLQALELIT